ncbi:MAG: hypothetical protein QOG03_883 [Actinomycetota bacterium]|jgi:hypothetical protein|nr:hypothetical protein [Actinomycetota bacterium]
MTLPHRPDEAGQIGGIEAVIFGLLIFVVGTLIVANAWGVIDAKLATSAAAREAARTYVEAPAGSDAFALADAAARDAIAGQGRDPLKMSLAPLPAPARCQRILADVTYPVPLISLPWVGHAGTGFTVHGRHSEVVDPYRSGLPGEASCA